MNSNSHPFQHFTPLVDHSSLETRMISATVCSKCPVCLNEDLSAPYWNKPRFHQCRQCGLIFRDPFPNAAVLSHLYSTSWMSPDVNIAETGATGIDASQSILKFLTRSIHDETLSGKHILDFGAGRGAMSLALRERGARVVAVEPFGYDCLAKLGVPTYRELSEIPSDIRFDGIVSLEVFEHLPDPRRTLLQLYQYLAPGGWLFITTPNAAGLNARLSGERWREAVRPGHVVFFTPPTLKSLLLETGFGRIERPRWFVRYTGHLQPRTIVNFAMQFVLVDGGLRLLAFK